VRRIVTLRMPAGLVEAIAAEKSVGKGGNRRSDVGEIASHKGRMFCTPPIDGPPRRRIVSKIFGCLFLLAVLGSYAWAGNVIQVLDSQTAGARDKFLALVTTAEGPVRCSNKTSRLL